jgi:aminoglycoside phosphotransferase family enzyme/predicted kinase
VDLEQLIAALSAASAYPYPVQAVEVRHTHISVVFLAGDYAYKIKKPVQLGFLDFSTLALRRHFCNEEVRLNRRLAPNVYLGVVPVTRDGTKLEVEGHGEVVEWAVKMERLPDDAMLQSRLRRGEGSPELMETLAGKVARFHADAESGEHISAFGRFEVVAGNARENFEQAAPLIGTTLSTSVYERLRFHTEEALLSLRTLIERRAERGVPRDTHGDLRLDHVYLFPDRKPPDDLVIIDCIEFNERFRFADPVADMAFLVMDLLFQGRRGLAGLFSEAYFRAADDAEGHSLLPFYTAYRAAVRAKIEGIELTEKEIPASERETALVRARAHWLLALGELEAPNKRPCLVLVAGLPGTGKSTLARGLAEHAEFCLIRSDVVRKELAGLADAGAASTAFGEGIYSPEWTDRTYAECLRRAEALLFKGKRVVVDASFREDKRRGTFLEAATALGVPGVLLLCKADADTVRARLRQRRNDASDATWAVYQWAADSWQEPSPVTKQRIRELATSTSPEQVLARALEVLKELGLRL